MVKLIQCVGHDASRDLSNSLHLYNLNTPKYYRTFSIHEKLIELMMKMLY